MTAEPPSLPLEPAGASGAEGQEPQWALVRATVDLPRHPRGDIGIVWLDDPQAQARLRSGLLEPLPAREQARIVIGADGQPAWAPEERP